jgi:hypothetical protein
MANKRLLTEAQRIAHREANKRYREAHKEEIRAWQAEWYQLNKSKINESRKKYAKNYRARNKERLKEYNRLRQQNLSEKEKQARRDYYHQNKEEIFVQRQIWKAQNKDRLCALQAKRRAQKLRATPAWLTEFDSLWLHEIYSLRRLRSKALGITFHVDHIVPLVGKQVCGLHVPWNLQLLPAEKNLKKRNKFVVE